MRNVRRLRGPAAKRFQSSAMGKFLMTVPTQMAGSCPTGLPARITLKSIDATMLIVGHMTSTVQQARTVPQTNGLSFPGVT